MNTKTRLALSSIAVLYLTSLIGCSGGGSSAGSNGDPATPTATVTATVTGLDPGTQYYFAVSAYNDLNGPCSNEVTTTPRSGAVSLEWNPVQDPTVSAYDVLYGKQSALPNGDCTYAASIQVPAPS